MNQNNYETLLKNLELAPLNDVNYLFTKIKAIYNKKKLLSLLNENNCPQTFLPHIVSISESRWYDEYYAEDLVIEFTNKKVVTVEKYSSRYSNRVNFCIGKRSLVDLGKDDCVEFIKGIGNDFNETHIGDFIKMLRIIQDEWMGVVNFAEGHIDEDFEF